MQNRHGLYLSKDFCNLLKILSALMVAIHHYAQITLDKGWSTNPIYEIFMHQGGYLGVAIFFFLSGYGLMESEKNRHLNWKDFLKRRFLKIYLPVVLVTLIWLPIFYYYHQDLIPKSVWGFLNHLFWDFCDPIFWFVRSLILLYASFFCFSIIHIRHTVLGYLFLILTTYLTFIISDPGVNIGIPLFTIGVFTSITKDKFYKGTNIMWPVTIALMLVSILIVIPQGLSMVMHEIIDEIFILTLLIICSSIKISFKFPLWLGLISFDLYLVHSKVLHFLYINCEEFSVILFLTLSILSSIIFYFLRTKTLKF